MKISISVEGDKEIKERFKQLSNFSKEVEDVVKEEADFLVERARENAPIRTGNLRKNINYSDIDISKGRFTFEIGIEDASLEPVAMRFHEEPFQLGPISQQQPSTPEGGVGPKFISRAVEYNNQRTTTNINEKVTDILSGQQKLGSI